MNAVCPGCGRGYIVADAYGGDVCPYGCSGDEQKEDMDFLFDERDLATESEDGGIPPGCKVIDGKVYYSAAWL